MEIKGNFVDENIKTQQLSDAITQRYLEYALSTIVSRSLPDVRDGLKPVHRRILYGMRQLKLDPKHGYKKCARVVGDVMGKYHPHGDASIYDAMVRLAQSFSVRYPLVMGQGNFGNIDGDSAAAMRYTEAKLTPYALAIMDGLDENGVDFMDTYSGEEKEPIVMPSLFPNLLANGSNGIAVGMATSIPPHNVIEVIDATIALIKNPDISIDSLVDFIKAPDFPTGGIINQTKESIIEIYKTGKGFFKLKAKWKKEELSYGNYEIVIYEIPYGVQKSKLVERIASLITTGKLSCINDIRDESSETVRIVIEPKTRIIDSELIMSKLFLLAGLEIKFALNMNVLYKGSVPKVMNLKEVLTSYIEHQIEVLERRINFSLTNIKDRLNILNGYLVAYLNLDKVIHIIREFDDSKSELMKEFNLNEEQAEAILNMKLRSLKKLEEFEIKTELEDLKIKQNSLNEILSSDANKRKKLISLIKDMRDDFIKDKIFAKRLTTIDYDEKESILQKGNFVIREPITIVFSLKGWIKAIKNHIDLNSSVLLKEGDIVNFIFHAYTTDKIILALSNGQFFTIDASKIPNGRGYGDPINLIAEIPLGVSVVNMFVYNSDLKFVLATKKGYGFVVNALDLLAQTKNGKQVVNLNDNDELLKIESIGRNIDMISLIGNNRKFLILSIVDIPTITKGKGVILQKFVEPGSYLSDFLLFDSSLGISWKNGNKNYKLTDFRLWQTKRGSIGHMPPDNFPRNNKFK